MNAVRRFAAAYGVTPQNALVFVMAHEALGLALLVEAQRSSTSSSLRGAARWRRSMRCRTHSRRARSALLRKVRRAWRGCEAAHRLGAARWRKGTAARRYGCEAARLCGCAAAQLRSGAAVRLRACAL